MTASVQRPFRVLLSAYVDLNVVDGSAFFVAGVASLLTSAPGVTVTVVAATPIRRPVVVQEMLVDDRVTLIDPFRDRTLAAAVPGLEGATRMDEATLARVLAHHLDTGHHDVVVVRSTTTAYELSRLRPDLGSRLCVYVTGVVAGDQEVEPGLLHRLQALVDHGATLLCQTPEMQEHLQGLLVFGADAGTVGVLTPAVPPADGLLAAPHDGPLLLAYTGKFAPAWHSVEMLAGFKEAVAAGADLRLVVAGDYFKRPPGWPTFGAEVRHLLGSHPAITWVGAVTREDSRALVAGSDVGLGWRHPTLDSSLELSTKLLEHGVLGRPCVINPTPMHQRLFGADYPLFASTMTEFVDLLGRMDRDRALVGHAAAVAHEVASGYTYPTVFASFFPTLLEASGLLTTGGSAAGARVTSDIAALTRGSARVVRSEDRWTAWLTEPRDVVEVLAQVGPEASVRDLERWGPFVRWTSGAGEGAAPLLDVLADVLTSPRGEEGLSAGAAGVAHDARGRVTLSAAPTEEPGAGSTGSSGSTGVSAGSATDVAGLRAALARAEADVALLTTRLEALSGTPLGRLQRAYWRLRRRLRPGGRRPR